MSETVTITHHETGTSAGAAGEYHAHVEGHQAIGRLTWVRRPGDRCEVRVAEHTLVPEALGGRGVAGELVKALVADARAQGFRILPQCSYVAASFDRHPEWSDLLA